MLTLKKKIEDQKSKQQGVTESRVSIRDSLLVKEVQEMELQLPRNNRVLFEDPNKLHSFTLSIVPDDGYWQGGRFKFHIEVPEDYNIVPPKVKCSTRIWHPNINEDGEVCLSLLRESSLDSMGWAPTRRLKDITWGLNSLFSDLLNFEDPLNVAAAEHYERDKESFVAKVKEYVQRYAKR
ncbi:hypothetical protein CAPTEDRAFT_205058 [Capitella teleta]|uniref:E2 NEDD8-conjugating enzyme n=1 Tax=Capitella teleta TaxID=283909 RepID=R7T999_CAPTE|nr:hypothetical protein CAPTEDRAFT_205058 [Capitella teleta]|eukprot:ELT90279.1 hypothetical protein CAPTEDRAFT_205058 [Capitella teleta]